MTTHAKTLTPDLGSRFSFDAQGEPLSGSYEATPMEMAAAFAAISRTHVHRRSYEMAAPPCHIDRNLFARIVVAALAVEKASYKHRARYQHRGMLGDLSIALLVALMNFGRKYGRIFPDYDTLAAMLRKTPETIIEAMKRLIQHGFVTKHRRSKLVGTPQGERRVQDSNCYEVHMPNAGLATVPIVADKVGSATAGRAASGSENPDVSLAPEARFKKGRPCSAEKKRAGSGWLNPGEWPTEASIDRPWSGRTLIRRGRRCAPALQ
jgi:hypothetical protein